MDSIDGQPRSASYEIEATCTYCGAQVYLENITDNLIDGTTSRTISDNRNHICQGA